MQFDKVDWTIKTAENGDVSITEKGQHGSEVTIATVEDFSTAMLISMAPPLFRAILAARPLLDPTKRNDGPSDAIAELGLIVEWYDTHVAPLLSQALENNLATPVSKVVIFAWKYTDAAQTTRRPLEHFERSADGWTVCNVHAKDTVSTLSQMSGEEHYDDYESAAIAGQKRAQRFLVDLVTI